MTAESRHIGFTGTRDITAGEAEWLLTDVLLNWLSTYDSFATGACVGVDTVVGAYLYQKFPAHTHVVYVPADRSRVCEWWNWPEIMKIAAAHEPPTIVYMPAGSTYKQRNAAIVSYSDNMIAVPRYPEDDGRSRRSGTWQTIRIAKAKGVPVNVYELNSRSSLFFPASRHTL